MYFQKYALAASKDICSSIQTFLIIWKLQKRMQYYYNCIFCLDAFNIKRNTSQFDFIAPEKSFYLPIFIHSTGNVINVLYHLFDYLKIGSCNWIAYEFKTFHCDTEHGKNTIISFPLYDKVFTIRYFDIYYKYFVLVLAWIQYEGIWRIAHIKDVLEISLQRL